MSAATTAIEWTDSTWNPMTGCTRVSAGCDHCYALTLANGKLREIYLQQPPVRPSELNSSDPFAPRFWEDRLLDPFSWRTPRRVFVDSMSDVFHAHFSREQIEQVFSVMNACSQHQFQVLTKRPERAQRYVEAGHIVMTENIWIGTSVESMEVAHRVEALRRVEAHVRFLSCEPLLGPLNDLDLSDLHWVVGGGESGIDARPCDPAWARGLRDRCLEYGVAFLWKQWGGRTPKSGGRTLDGRCWDEYPVPHPLMLAQAK